MNDIELLSPCGSYESLMAAIQGGCNSVYFGIEQLNMRARESINFSLEDVEKIAAIAREHQIKCYITLNSVIYNHEIPLTHTIINTAKEAGITAIIASDNAVMNYARKVQMPIHISTQANITNTETVDFFSQYADVMVLARELSLEQVSEIAHQIRERNIIGPSGNLVKLEVFAHGSLCMAVSGKCYISLHNHNVSANRGECAQNCRRKYVVTDKVQGMEMEIDNEYIMSAKDLCTIDFLDKVVSAGVSVLKIEGRGRSEEYVYTTTSCYREAITAIDENSFTKEKVDDLKERLETVFNRGFWDGYYLGRKMGEWSDDHGSKATQKKVYVGKGMNYFDKINVAEFKIESQPISVGDTMLVIGPTTGIIQETVRELRVNELNCNEAIKGDLVSIPLSSKIRPSDKLYKLVERFNFTT